MRKCDNFIRPYICTLHIELVCVLGVAVPQNYISGCFVLLRDTKLRFWVFFYLKNTQNCQSVAKHPQKTPSTVILCHRVPRMRTWPRFCVFQPLDCAHNIYSVSSSHWTVRITCKIRLSSRQLFAWRRFDCL